MLAYQKALSSYNSGDLLSALQNMRESYALSGHAELLFNLARLESELHHCQAALRDYESYLRGVPNGKLRSDAERATQELQRECPEPPASNPENGSIALKPAPAQVLVAVPEPPAEQRNVQISPLPAAPVVDQPSEGASWDSRRIVGWSLIASGVVSGGAALYFWNAAVGEHNEAAQLAAPYKYAPKDPPWLAQQDAQHRDLRAARILGITAGALVAGGAIVLSLSPKKHSSGRASATLAPNPGYLGAICSGSF
jgi:hypothetical protein